MTTLLEDVLFGLPDSNMTTVRVDQALVRSRLEKIAEDEDLRRQIPQRKKAAGRVVSSR